MPDCRLVVLALVAVVGCNRHLKQRPAGTPASPPEPCPLLPCPTPPSPPPLAAAPPPLAAVADVPGLPDPSAPPAVAAASHVEPADDRRPKPKPAPAPTPAPPSATSASPSAMSASAGDRAAVAKLVEAAAARWATVPDFEARLVKREVANGRVVPQSEISYRYRQAPHSVYMKVVGGAGVGREVLYVQGRFGDKMHVVTGKGDHPLVGAGFRSELDPLDKQATSKSRYKVTEAGFGRMIAGLRKQLDNPAATLKALGVVSRSEYPYPLDGVEGVFKPGDDPLLPKGGTRQVYFDPKSDSPGYRLPVLVVCQEPDGREVEYYAFDKLVVPSGWTDADWNPKRLK